MEGRSDSSTTIPTKRKAGKGLWRKTETEQLSAEERRIIGEYFPEFNKSEDVRHSTQVANTKSTYEKIGHYLEDAGIQKS